MKKYDFANLFYFRCINNIGGTEQFLYEIAKKYHNRDIAIIYDKINADQLRRLKRLVRCIKRDPEAKYKVKRAFYSYTTEIMPQIEADEHIFVCHAIYQNIMMEPPLAHPELSRWICVSRYALKSLKEYAVKMGKDITPELCYNPLTLEKPQPILKIISAGRLEDTVKGGKRTVKLMEAVDKYAKETGRKYLWLVFSNPSTQIENNNPNVVFMKPRTDVRDFIADSDWLVQLSDDMESYCYSINEALGYGTGVVRTPLSVMPEFKVPEGADLECAWDMNNADEIAKKMFEPRKTFTYKPPKDGWSTILTKDLSNYKPPKPDTKVKCISTYWDLELKCKKTPESPPYIVKRERAEYLSELELVRIME